MHLYYRPKIGHYIESSTSLPIYILSCSGDIDLFCKKALRETSLVSLRISERSCSATSALIYSHRSLVCRERSYFAVHRSLIHSEGSLFALTTLIQQRALLNFHQIIYHSRKIHE